MNDPKSVYYSPEGLFGEVFTQFCSRLGEVGRSARETFRSGIERAGVPKPVAADQRIESSAIASLPKMPRIRSLPASFFRSESVSATNRS